MSDGGVSFGGPQSVIVIEDDQDNVSRMLALGRAAAALARLYAAAGSAADVAVGLFGGHANSGAVTAAADAMRAAMDEAAAALDALQALGRRP